MHRVLAPCAGAIAVSTSVLLLVGLFDLDDVSSSALTLDASKLAASALFLAAGILRLSRWRVTTDQHSGLLASAMVVLGLVSLPLGNLTGQVLAGPVEPLLALGVRAAGTAACVALALRAIPSTTRRPHRCTTLLVATAFAVAGVVALVGLFTVAPPT